MSIASIDYGGWDSHRSTINMIEGQLNDIFGLGKGLDTLVKELELVAPEILDKIVIMVSGEFGRQLSSNGSQGSDHGTGNSMLLIGKPVKSGCYGEMFPISELGGENINPKHTFAQANSDIEGLTSMNQVYGRVCEWLAPSSAETVIPGWSGTMMESNVNMANLFSS